MSVMDAVRAHLTAPINRESAEQVMGTGLPHAKTESWRYSARALGDLDFTPPHFEGDAPSWPAAACDVLVAGEQLTCLPSTGVSVSAATIGGELPAGEAQSFARLMLADGTPCVRLRIERATTPLRLSLHSPHSGYHALRLLIDVAPGVNVHLIEDLHGGHPAGIVNRWVDLRIAAGASVQWLRWQRHAARSVQRTDVALSTEARLSYTAVECDARFARHDLNVRLEGQGANAMIDGLVVVNGRQHHDTQLALRHSVLGAHSRTRWRMIASDRARSVFSGLIHVAPGADCSEAHLKTANLLLSPHAEIDTKPELVIEADEVVCSHGATVGQLDDKALFYLRSRGVSEPEARRMLTVAFGGDVLSSVSDVAVRETMAAVVAAKVAQ